MVNRFSGQPESDVLILTPVVRRIAREHRVGMEVARNWLEDALRFLDRAAAADGMIEPEPEADRAWHQFILFTRDYEQYCQERFGRFIHHQPFDHEPARRRRLLDRLRGEGAGGGGCGGVTVGGGDGGGDGGGSCGGGCGGGS